jgi:hypothetical protein
MAKRRFYIFAGFALSGRNRQGKQVGSVVSRAEHYTPTSMHEIVWVSHEAIWWYWYTGGQEPISPHVSTFNASEAEHG